MTIIDMRDKLHQLLAGAGHNSAIDTLARRINRNLMVFGDQLCDLGTSQVVTLQRHPDGTHDADSIAAAAAILLEGHRGEADCVQLLLPPSEFLAQSVQLPGVVKSDARAAIKLQMATRLPEQEQSLEPCLVFNPETDQQTDTLVWWMPVTKAAELFDAMATRSIFLAAIMPRPAWLIGICLAADQSSTNVIVDCDDQMQTYIGRITQSFAHGDSLQLDCLQTSLADLADAQIADTWHAELMQSGMSQPDARLNSVDDYLRFLRGHNLPVLHAGVSQGAVFPEGALAARHQLDRGKRRTLLMRAVAAAIAIVMLPGIYQSWQLSSLSAELEQLRVDAAEPRSNQAAVRDFESQWGVLTEFPDQDVIAVMLALQEVINPGVLTAFSINEGLISIEGESQDPQNVLEMLEQNPLFTEVDFARATNNNRYFIDLRLATVNFPAYQEWHFPGQR